MKRALISLLAVGVCACGALQKPEAARSASAPAPRATAFQAPSAAGDDNEPPPPGLAPDAPFPAIAHRELAGGLSLDIVEHHTLPIVELLLVLRSGQASDGAKAGLAAVTGQLLKAGGAGAWSARQLAERAEALGARLSIAVDRDATRIGIAVMKTDLDAALELVSAVARQPRFDKSEFFKLRQREIERVASASRSDGSFMAKMVLYRELFELPSGLHPYARYDATVTELMHLDLEDCRAWHKAHVTAKNAFLVITGDVAPEEASAAAQRAFDGWSGERPPSPSFAVPRPPNRTSVYVVDWPGSKQSQIYLATLGPELKGRAFPALKALNQVLGGVSGRLFLDVREQRSLAYSTSSSVEELAQGPLPIVLGAGTETAKTAQASAALLAHLGRLASSPPNEQEVSTGSRYLANSLTIATSTRGAIASMTARLGVFELPDDWYDDYRRELVSIDSARVGELGARYFKQDRAVIAVAGDAARIAEPLRRFGPVTVVDPARGFSTSRTLTHDPSVPMPAP